MENAVQGHTVDNALYDSLGLLRQIAEGNASDAPLPVRNMRSMAALLDSIRELHKKASSPADTQPFGASPPDPNPWACLSGRSACSWLLRPLTTSRAAS